ncbi:MAG: molybdate ABC transporter substrate-binding protein [Chloroflexota bacterium]
MPKAKFRLWCLFVVLLPLLLAACVGGGTAVALPAAPAAGVPHVQGTVTVFAAASLTDAFKALGAVLQQANPGSTVTFNFGGSPTLRTQLAQGAHADVFASADAPNMQGAQKEGSISGSPTIFAQNKLTVIVPAANPAGITTLQDLAKPGVKLDLAEAAVPVGNYARQAFAKMGQDPGFGSTFGAAVAKNVVSYEADVKQVVAKVQLGEADAGVVYQTDVTAAVRSALKLIAIPDQFNIIAQYPIAVVQGAPNADGAQAFISFVLSPAGQAVLAKYGFTPPPVPGAVAASRGRSDPSGATGT